MMCRFRPERRRVRRPGWGACDARRRTFRRNSGPSTAPIGGCLPGASPDGSGEWLETWVFGGCRHGGSRTPATTSEEERRARPAAVSPGPKIRAGKPPVTEHGPPRRRARWPPVCDDGWRAAGPTKGRAGNGTPLEAGRRETGRSAGGLPSAWETLEASPGNGSGVCPDDARETDDEPAVMAMGRSNLQPGGRPAPPRVSRTHA